MADRNKRGKATKKGSPSTPDVIIQQEKKANKDVEKIFSMKSSDKSLNSPFKASLNPSPLQVIRASLGKGKTDSPEKSLKGSRKLNVFELVSDDESPVSITAPKAPKTKKYRSKTASFPVRVKVEQKENKSSRKSPKSSPAKQRETKTASVSRGKKSETPKKSSPAKRSPPVVSPARSQSGRSRSKQPSKQTSKQASKQVSKQTSKQSPVSKRKQTSKTKRDNVNAASEDVEAVENVPVKRVSRKRQPAAKSVRSTASKSKRAKMSDNEESQLEASTETSAHEVVTSEDNDHDIQKNNIESSSQEESIVVSRRRPAARRRTTTRRRNYKKKEKMEKEVESGAGEDENGDIEEERQTTGNISRKRGPPEEVGDSEFKDTQTSECVLEDDEDKDSEEQGECIEGDDVITPVDPTSKETEEMEDEDSTSQEDVEDDGQADAEDLERDTEVVTKRRRIGGGKDNQQQQQQQQQQEQQGLTPPEEDVEEVMSNHSGHELLDMLDDTDDMHQEVESGPNASSHSSFEKMDFDSETLPSPPTEEQTPASVVTSHPVQSSSSTTFSAEPTSKPPLNDSMLMSFAKSESSPRKDVKSLSSLTKKNPSLVKTASWPKSNQKTTSLTKITTTKAQGPLAQSATVAKKPESQQEKGEKQMFFEEIYYLLDSFVPAQPVSIRSFSIVTMATNCLKVEFRKKLNTYRLAPRIMTCLQDASSNPLLRLSTSFLLFMFTRDYSLPLFFDRRIFESIASILETEVEAESSYSESTESDKDSKEYGMLEKKVRFCLEQWSREQYMTTSGRAQHQISTDLLSPGDLIVESVIAITNPRRKQHFKNVLRQLGVLDPVAKRVMNLVRKIESSPPSDVISEELDLLLKRTQQGLVVLEQVILNCYDNQCYLVVFEGSALVCSLSKLLRVLIELVVVRGDQGSSQEDLEVTCESRSVIGCLLTLLKLLSSLTHDNEMACIRLGENVGVMDQVVKCSLQAPHYVAADDKFHVTILGLTVLINLTEHSPTERAVFKKPWYLCPRKEDKGKSVLEHISRLFCKHFSAADSIDISLPNMIEQPMKAEEGTPAKDNTSSEGGVSTEGGSQLAPPTSGVPDPETTEDNFGGPSSSQGGKMEMNFDDSFEYVSDEDEEDSFEHEKSVADLSTSLVINREEFNQALEQAGQQLEDSLVAFYCALLLGTLSRHDRGNCEIVRSCMPSKSFSEMIKILENFLSFLDYAKLGSKSSTDSVREIVSFLSESQESHSQQE